MGCSCSDWLEDFVEHTSSSKFCEEARYWTGVSVIAGALRRKVWIDEGFFQWTPNFFVLLVGPAGGGKSTCMGLGYRLLRRIDGINFGANITTWEQLVKKLADLAEVFEIGGQEFVTSCMSFEISEFGTFFDPENRAMVDGLTDLWDAKLGSFIKETKTNGSDEIVNPWLNMIAGCTQGWIDDNITARFVQSGFASRLLYVPFYETREVAYPSREMKIEDMYRRERELEDRLRDIANISGEMRLTEEAYVWGEQWYHQYKLFLNRCREDEVGLYARSQTTMHKLAMVISVSKGKFPWIGVEDLIEADKQLSKLSGSINKVFGRMGQTPQSKLAMDMLDVLVKQGNMKKKELFAKYFFRTVSSQVFEEALKSLKAGGMVKEMGDLSNPVLEVV